jgi:4-amino-4-deoxy-L-arabinose transferase-like glycosyltransferase
LIVGFVQDEPLLEKPISRVLSLIIIAYLVLASAYARSIPIGEAPDEPAHFLYARHVAETGSLPPPAPPQRDSFWKQGFVTSGYEWHQPPLTYGLLAGVLVVNRWGGFVPQFEEFPAINPAFPGEGIPLFVAVPFRFSDAHLLRLTGILIGLVTLLTIYWMAWRLCPDQQDLALLATGFVGLIPQFIFLHAYITNDTLAILMSSLGLAALVNVAMSESQSERRAWLVAGLICSVAIATKLTTLFLIPLAAVLVLLLLVDRGRSRTVTLKNLFYFVLMLPIFPLLFWLLFPDLLWRVLNSPPVSGIRPEHLSLQYWIDGVLPMLHVSFWGMFGWVNIPIARVFVLLFDAIALVGLCVAGVALLRHWQMLAMRQRRSLVLLGISIVVVLLQFVGFNLTIFQGQGRFLYPAIAAIGVFVALGWVDLAGRRRRWVMLALLGLMIIVNAVVYTTTIAAVYRS